MIDKSFLNQIKLIKRKERDKAGAIGVYRFTLENEDGSRTEQYYHNIITKDAFEMILNNMTSPTPDNDLLLSHALLGTGTDVVSENDHHLKTEVYRNAIASKTNVSNVGYVTAFFSQTEVTGTFKEAGIVSDGSDWASGAGKDTGVLFSHVNIDVTKTNAQKLTIDWMVTLINAA